MRLIDADKLKIEMMKAFDCEDATKYGNKNAEQQAHSYSTLMLYEISDVVEDCIDSAPTVELDESVIQEVLNKRCMTAVSNEYLIALHGTRPEFQTESLISRYQNNTMKGVMKNENNKKI